MNIIDGFLKMYNMDLKLDLSSIFKKRVHTNYVWTLMLFIHLSLLPELSISVAIKF